ncbi:hypothetical protein K470DRAFT_205121, partial [Piedraia hortae CBS 480.64]
WPSPLPGNEAPTPYQIFAMGRNEHYTKTRFLQLAKIYHPDISHHSGLSRQVRLERYRLVVAAHHILSDPVKRSTYDRLGAGWERAIEVSERRSKRQDPIWQNATWEDWERFYQNCNDECTKKKCTAPVYMPNSHFAVLVICLAILGSTANSWRAQESGSRIVEKRDNVHDQAARELRRLRHQASGLSDRDERIQWFLRSREAASGKLPPTEVDAWRDESIKRLLPLNDTCRS